MLKEEVLSVVSQAAKENIVTLAEIESTYINGIDKDAIDPITHKKLSIADVLYLVGGLIVVVGIAVLVGENWAKLGPVLRVLVTLGASVVTFIAGYLISKKIDLVVWSVAFYLIASIIMPLGFYTLLELLGFINNPLWLETLIAGLAFAVNAIVFFKFRNSVHLIFSFLFGIWFYYSVIQYFYGQYSFDADVMSYITIVLGIALMSLGVSVSISKFKKISGLVFTTATFMILVSCFVLQGFGSDARFFWEGIYPVICFVLIFLSSELKSKAVLVVSTLMLMVYIMKITGEYFAESLGWPLALVFAGLLLMGVGYMAYYLNKRQLQKRESAIAPGVSSV